MEEGGGVLSEVKVLVLDGTPATSVPPSFVLSPGLPPKIRRSNGIPNKPFGNPFWSPRPAPCWSRGTPLTTLTLTIFQLGVNARRASAKFSATHRLKDPCDVRRDPGKSQDVPMPAAIKASLPTGTGDLDQSHES